MNETVAQALEVAQLEAGAEAAQAEAAQAVAEANATAAEAGAEAQVTASETAVEVAQIAANRDVEVARIQSESMQRDLAMEDRCRRIEESVLELERRILDKLTKLELQVKRDEPEKVQKVHVHKMLEKPKPKKPPAQVNGGLYFGR